MNIRKVIKTISYQLSAISYYWRWHPEVALRYLPIVARIKKQESKIRDLKILEIGSGSLGIAPYLKMPVTGLDVDFSGPKFSLLKQVQGKATKIPFKDKSFEIVLSVDLLEHLPQEKREKVIEEMLRVARKEVIIGVPCGREAFLQDKQLDREYRQVFKEPFPYLKEHLEYGLTEKEEILELINYHGQSPWYPQASPSASLFFPASSTGKARGIRGSKIKKTKRRPQIQITGNENLGLRYFLMKGWMTKNIFVDFLFRKIMLFLIPLFQMLDKPPYYRQIFFVKINSNNC